MNYFSRLLIFEISISINRALTRYSIHKRIKILFACVFFTFTFKLIFFIFHTRYSPKFDTVTNSIQLLLLYAKAITIAARNEISRS